MLDLLAAPGAGDLLEGRVVVEHVAKISRIVAAIALDHGGGLDDPQDLRIDPRAVEPVPGDVLQRPAFHEACITPTLVPGPQARNRNIAPIFGCRGRLIKRHASPSPRRRPGPNVPHLACRYMGPGLRRGDDEGCRDPQ